MIKAALKSVVAHKLRLGLTALAIVLGVAFVAGTYVFTDTINSTFTTLIDDVYQGTDVVVRSEDPGFGVEQVGLPESLVDEVRAVEGVGAVAPSVEGIAQIVKDGEAIGGQGPPTLGFSWTDETELTPLTLRDGRAPTGSGELLIDAATADGNAIATGDVVTIVALGPPEEFEVVGIASFGESDSLAGATLSIFDYETAQRLFNSEGMVQTISIAAAPGVSPDDLTERVGGVLPQGVEAISGADQVDETLAEVAEGLSFLNIALLSFAAVAVFVGAFIIYNTFRIIVAQRSRELALLRAIGATGGQVTWMVIVEAFFVALVASAVGIVLGIGVAAGIRGLMAAVGFTPPEGPLTIEPRTIVVGFAVGLIVTLVSALLPARRASRVSPVEAMREGGSPPRRRSLATRAITGTVVAVVGIGSLFVGLFVGVSNAIAYVGFGALVTFLGVAILSPLAAKPIAKFVGWPLPRTIGVTGKLAQENAMRTPRRTASTASALMIGVALVAFVAIFASSISASVRASIFDNFPADLSVQYTNFAEPGMGGISPDLGRQLREIDELESVSPIQFGQFRKSDGGIAFVTGVDTATIADVYALGVQSGSLDAAADGGVMLHVDTADDLGVTVGDTIEMEFALTGVQSVTVDAIFERNDLNTPYMLATPVFHQNFTSRFDQMIFANVAAGSDLATARTAMEGVAADFGNVEVQDKGEFVAQQEAQINGILALFYGLLGLAIVIAVLGITNTLALSVFERTREIGLLRAVGMARRQVRSMIHWESVIIALFGAILGVAVGSLFGWSVVTALADEGIEVLAFPWVQLAIFIVAAGIAGVVAAALPALKASRLNVLEAIAYE